MNKIDSEIIKNLESKKVILLHIIKKKICKVKSLMKLKIIVNKKYKMKNYDYIEKLFRM